MQKKDKILKKLFLFQSITLLQFLIVAIFFIRSNSLFIVVIDFFVTLLCSTAIILYIFFKLNKLFHGFLGLSIVFGFFILVFLNGERIFFSNYYLVLIKNESKFNQIMKADSNRAYLINQVENLKGVSSCDGNIFFYFEEAHPSFHGIAYSTSSENPIRTGQMLQQIHTWFHLYGNWYFWYAHDPY